MSKLKYYHVRRQFTNGTKGQNINLALAIK